MLWFRIQVARQPSSELFAVEKRVSADVVTRRLAVVLAPRPQQGIRSNDNDAVVPFLTPLPFKQGFANVAHVAEARIGRLRQVGDAPCPTGIAKENSQDCGRSRGEDRSQSSGFGFWPVCNRAIDVHIAEGEASVPDQIEIGDIMICADRPRLGRQVGTHEHGDQTPAGIAVTGRTNIR